MAMAMAPATILLLTTTILLLLSTPAPPPSAAAASSSPAAHPSPSFSASPSPAAAAEYKVYIVLLKPPVDAAHVTMDDEARRDWHLSFLPSAVTAHGERLLARSYETLFHGFAAWLTEDELEAVSRKPGFGRWFPDGIMYPDTTQTPAFLGLTKDAGGVWANSNYGKGVVIGVLDSGVDSNHPSFDDTGMPSPPAKWKGACTGTGVRCNNKLVGARSVLDDNSSSKDVDGHSTHVSSTAAGNFVANASYFNGGQAAETAAGIAPGAHLAMYKVCNLDECPKSAVLDGFNAALRDGVDVISVSINHRRAEAPPYYEDAVTMGAFRAVAKGILVVSSAGNKGPDRSSVGNDAPWHLTVGAGSVHRRIAADIVLENGDLVQGEALVQGVNSNTYHPLHCPGEGDRQCIGVSADSARGHIVICDDAGPSFGHDTKALVVRNLYDRGAAQVVIVLGEEWGYALPLIAYGASTVQVPAAVGRKIRDYCQYPDAAAQVSFGGTRVDVGGAPMVASFSGRGPSRNNPFVMKPDILAPGRNILAAARATLGPKPFVFMLGTSTATPHVSGVAALLKSLHPEWSPAAIRSAIMTTGNRFDNEGGIILDEQCQRASVLGVGAGHVNPERAVNPSLVYDMDASDYAAFICDVFGPHDDVQDLIGDLGLNYATLPTGVREIRLNYPSLVVPTNTTVQRTLTKVGPGAEIYYAFVFMRDSVQVKVSPNNLRFYNPGETHSFQVSADYQGKNAPVEGILLWQSPYHAVSSSIVVLI